MLRALLTISLLVGGSSIALAEGPGPETTKATQVEKTDAAAKPAKAEKASKKHHKNKARKKPAAAKKHHKHHAKKAK